VFVGDSVKIRMNGGRNYFNVVLRSFKSDEVTRSVLETTDTEESYTVAENLNDGAYLIFIVKRTEAVQRTWTTEFGLVELHEVMIANGKLLPPMPHSTKRIEFIGDSDTTAYQVQGKETDWTPDPGHQDIGCSWAHVAAEHLEAQATFVAWSGKGLKKNACHCILKWCACDSVVVPELYTRSLAALPDSKMDWESWVPQAVVIFLGANDFLGRAWSPSELEFTEAYLDLIRQVRERRPQATIHCMSQCQEIVSGETPCKSCVGALSSEQISETLHLLVEKVVERCADSKVLHFRISQTLGHGTGHEMEWGGEKHWGVRGHQQVGYCVAQHLGATHNWPVLPKMFDKPPEEVVSASQLKRVGSSTPGLQV